MNDICSAIEKAFKYVTNMPNLHMMNASQAGNPSTMVSCTGSLSTCNFPKLYLFLVNKSQNWQN